MNIKMVGNGKVVLIAGGGKLYSDMAAKFCRSSKPMEDIIGAPEDLKLLDTIVHSPHKAVLEFDDFIFGVEGYSRVTEVQLVRKRHASYMISSGRGERKGKRTFDMVVPESLIENDTTAIVGIEPDTIKVCIGHEDDVEETLVPLKEIIQGYINDVNEKCIYDDPYLSPNSPVRMEISPIFLLDAAEKWYKNGIDKGIPEEDLRYLKPQATEFRACIKMNAAALKDWFAIRMCNRAAVEIRDLANKMYQACMKITPELFEHMGPNCKLLGYCPENGAQCMQCRGKIPTQIEAMKFLKENWKPNEQ